ncbi:hypothetical protein ADT71_08595 [Novosphingobium sp. ST904]|nr:hypothetical protein ADT71_08595 [Novosphingobium sp. ST904]
MTRFLALVDQTTITRDGCWIWCGSGKGNGYGSFNLNGKTECAHRAAYILFNHEHPGRLDVCHRCDNRACVNPDHLFLGTRLENMQDCMRKGRTARGERLNPRKGENGPAAKLNWDQVRAIRASTEPARALAARYGVSSDNINRIRRNETWKAA